MAKDPAFLFYSSDFLIGTVFFSNEQVGKYIKLLCYQHQFGSLSKSQALAVLVQWDNLVMSKFILEEGLYYNKRLRDESVKRNKFCESRRESINKRYVRSTHVDHTNLRMEDVNENEIEDVNVVKNKKVVFRKPTLQQVIDYCKEIGTSVDPEQFWHNYESSGWVKANGQKVLNWKSTIRTWEKRDQKPVDKLTETQKRNIAKFNEFEKTQKEGLNEI